MGLLKGIEKGEKIGSTDYYGVINGENLIAREGTEYSEVANLQLLWCEDPDSPGLHLATVNEEIPSPENPFQPTTFTAAAPRLELSNYARSFAHGALAELGIAADRALLPEENLFHRDEGLFLWSQHARLHRTTAGGFGYRGNLNGGSVGWIRVRTFSQRLILGRGALASYANVRTKFFGSAVSRGKELRQWRWNGVAFATLEYFNAHQRLSRFRVAAGGGLSRGRASREDGQGKRFSASLGGAQAFASLAGFRELLRPGNWQIGPRVELIYNWQRQNAYAETSDAALGAATVDGVGHHFLTTALGLGLGKNFANRENANRGGQISSALAWNCQAMRHHNRPTARIQGTGFDEFSPLITYGERNFATISLKMHRHLDRQWTISFYWRGDFAHGRTDFRAGAQLCHKF
jgi:hypothetical protein